MWWLRGLRRVAIVSSVICHLLNLPPPVELWLLSAQRSTTECKSSYYLISNFAAGRT